MKAEKHTKVWNITGHDGLKMIYECEIPISSITQKQLGKLLLRLGYKELDRDEIVNSSLRKNAKNKVSPLIIDFLEGKNFCLQVQAGAVFYTAVAKDSALR